MFTTAAVVATLVGATFADVPAWLLLLYALAAIGVVLWGLQLSRWRMVANEEGIAIDPGPMKRRKSIRWEDLEAISMSRPALLLREGKPVRVPLSTHQLQALEGLVAEAKDQPTGSLLKDSAPLFMESVPKWLLVMAGGVFTAIAVTFLIVVPVARMAAAATGVEHRALEGLSALAFLLGERMGARTRTDISSLGRMVSRGGGIPTGRGRRSLDSRVPPRRCVLFAVSSQPSAMGL